MSRIIVKNLPKSITEDKIREVFGKKGHVTDVQLKYTAEGVFRQFGFVGYHNESEAEAAIEYFNNSMIKTSKLIVEKCALLGDKTKTKSWSKYAPDSSAYKQKHVAKLQEIENAVKKQKLSNNEKREKYREELLKKHMDDPLFEDYLQVHDPKYAEHLANLKRKADGTQNDNESEDEDEEVDDGSEDEADNKLANKSITDSEYMKQLMKKPEKTKKVKEPKNIDLYLLKLRDLPYSCKKKDIKHFFKPVVPFTIRLPRNVKGIAYVGFKQETQLNKALLKDKSFISGKQISVNKYTKDGKGGDVDKFDMKKVKWAKQEDALKNEEEIAESGRIFLRNLSYSTTEADIEKLFETYGSVVEVNLPIDKETRQLKGFGTVTFLLPEQAVKAYSELDGTVFHGRMLHLLPAKANEKDQEKQQKGNDDEGGGASNYKQQKLTKDKAKAGSAHNWNALFLGADAVASKIADKYGMRKETAVLDADDSNQVSAAVRLALGETQIVAETRKYLENEGVHLDAFSNLGTKRSKVVIIVKNLPANTEAMEIRKMFEPHGVLGRLIFPPSGISALVEFVEPTEARKAFTKLAYTKFKHLPLYLEWAPENALNASNSSSKSTSDEATTDKVCDNVNETEAETVEPEPQVEPEPDTTLYVKNLHFDVRDSTLHSHFSTCGKLKYATVALKKDPANPGMKLSMGYGFVQYFLKQDVNKALKNLQGSSLEGRSVELKRSERTLASDVPAGNKVRNLDSKPTGAKMLVRNVPFQAKWKEINDLFKVFGEIKALRLPKKMASNDEHRGFAFVEFITESDAKKAFAALSQSTHLYGRRLVLEWANQQEDVDEIRKRTAERFHKQDSQKKSRKSVFEMAE